MRRRDSYNKDKQKPERKEGRFNKRRESGRPASSASSGHKEDREKGHSYGRPGRSHENERDQQRGGDRTSYRSYDRDRGGQHASSHKPGGGQQVRNHADPESIVYGVHSIEELFRVTGVYGDDRLLLSRHDESKVLSILTRARKQGIAVERRKPEQLTELCGSDHHQGIVLLRYQKTELVPLEPEDMVQNGGLYVAVENVTDPGNLGALIRSMAAFGARGLFISKFETAPLNHSVMKSSAGHMARMPVHYVPRMGSFLLQAQKLGVLIVGTSLEGELLSRSAVEGLKSQGRPILLVMGSEEKGLSQLVMQRCDYLFKIPISSDVQSLNVSAAGAVILYEFSLASS